MNCIVVTFYDLFIQVYKAIRLSKNLAEAADNNCRDNRCIETAENDKKQLNKKIRFMKFYI